MILLCNLCNFVQAETEDAMRTNNPPGQSPHVKKETSIPFAGVMLAVILFFSNLLTVGARFVVDVGREITQAFVPSADSAPRLAFAGGSPPGPAAGRSKQSDVMCTDSRAGGYLPRATRHQTGQFGGGGLAFA